MCNFFSLTIMNERKKEKNACVCCVVLVTRPIKQRQMK